MQLPKKKRKVAPPEARVASPRTESPPPEATAPLVMDIMDTLESTIASFRNGIETDFQNACFHNACAFLHHTGHILCCNLVCYSHSLTHSLIRSLTHSLTRSLIHSCIDYY